MGRTTGFEVIPAIDLQDGEVVQLRGGRRGTERHYGKPVATAKRWVRDGAETLHVVDLDGAFSGNRANAAAIDAIRDGVDCRMQLGGGIRSVADAEQLFERGINRVILGTAAVESPEIVDELAEQYPDGVIVSLDAKDGEVVVEGWTKGTGLDPVAAAGEYADRGAGAILFTDVDVEGQLAGVQESVIERVVDAVDIPVIASGGVSSLEDLRTIRDTGARAVVVGTALYEEQFELSSAIEAVNA